MAIPIKKGQSISQFTVKDLLPEGSGGMATVVRAFSRQGIEVALKISHAADERYYADALIAESEILQKLDNVGVVRILPIETDIGKTRYMERATELPGHPWFFVMEFLAGGSLRDWLKKVGVVAPGEASFIAREITRALEYVHSKSYVHNDVKEDNVLFRRTLEKGGTFEPVLIDFGIAAKTKRIQQDAGSLQWMSPERLQQVRHELAPEVKVDATKVDVYSVGVLLHRMLTARMPFTGTSEGRITSAILHKSPEHVRSANSAVPLGLDELIVACMAKRPEARPSTRELRKELAQYSTDRIVVLPKSTGFLGRFG
jgi:serine/threonine-protein kinase